MDLFQRACHLMVNWRRSFNKNYLHSRDYKKFYSIGCELFQYLMASFCLASPVSVTCIPSRKASLPPVRGLFASFLTTFARLDSSYSLNSLFVAWTVDLMRPRGALQSWARTVEPDDERLQLAFSSSTHRRRWRCYRS